LEDIKLAGFIFEPYNDGQFIVKTTAFRAYNLPGYDNAAMQVAMDGNVSTVPTMSQVGDMDGAALSVLVDGLSDDGYLADTKVFGSFAWSKTRPDAGQEMLGSLDSETGTSYWFGTQLPLLDGKLGLEFNHGSKYWYSFTNGSSDLLNKLATRGDVNDMYAIYQIDLNQFIRVGYTMIDYDYTGSGWHIGEPVKTADYVNRAYGVYNLRF